MSYADKAVNPFNLLSATEEFMRRGGQRMDVWDFGAIDGTLVEDNIELRKLRIKLLQEEMREYLLAEGTDPDLDVIHFVDNPNATEILDGLLDIIVIAWGTALSYFGPTTTQQAANEVIWSNLSKVIGKGLPKLRDDGKIMKPPGWLAPDIKGVLEGTAGYPE